MEEKLEIKELKENLNSTDPSIRRTAAESFFSQEIPDTLIEDISNKLQDEDIGVRDIISQILILSENNSIPKFVVPFVSSEDISIRNLAGEILLRKGDKSLDAMIDYVPEGNDDDKKFVIDVMGLIGDKRPWECIVKVLKENENENVILAAIEALGNIKCEESVQEIIKKFEENELYQPTVVEALGKIGTKESLKYIYDKFNEVDELSKFPLIESLGTFGDQGAFYLLLAELKNLKDALAWAAVKSLKELKDRFELDVPYDESMKNSLLNTLVDADLEYKKAAADLMSTFNDKEIIETAIKVFGIDDEINQSLAPKFFENPAIVYPKISAHLANNPKNTKQLLELLKELIGYNNEAFLSLSEMENKNISLVLTNNLEHPDEEVRRSAIELLFYCDYETAIMFLDTIIDDDDFWNRLRLLEILESCEDERINDALIKLASDPEDMVKEKAVWLLNQRGINNLEFKA